MKIIRNKHNKLKPNADTAAAAKPRSRSHSLEPKLYKVVLFADTLATRSLYYRRADFHRILISPGPEDDCFLVRVTASATQLLKVAAWAAHMEPNVTVRSPSALREFVRLLAGEKAADIITLAA